MIVLKNKSNFLINRNNNDDILDVSWKKQDKSKRVNKTSSTIHFLELSWYWTDLRMNKKSGLIIREEWFDVEQCHTQNAFISFFELESGLILIMIYFHNELSWQEFERFDQFNISLISQSIIKICHQISVYLDYHLVLIILLLIWLWKV